MREVWDRRLPGMKIKIEIECNNAAFQEDGPCSIGKEVSYILQRYAASMVERKNDFFANYRKNKGYDMLKDSNGNTVGKVTFHRS